MHKCYRWLCGCFWWRSWWEHWSCRSGLHFVDNITSSDVTWSCRSWWEHWPHFIDNTTSSIKARTLLSHLTDNIFTRYKICVWWKWFWWPHFTKNIEKRNWVLPFTMSHNLITFSPFINPLWAGLGLISL